VRDLIGHADFHHSIKNIRHFLVSLLPVLFRPRQRSRVLCIDVGERDGANEDANDQTKQQQV
jgi:hypothetical protein